MPRVRELIEAGMTGALAEDTVVKCLTVNDSLCQVLEFVEHPEKCEQSAAAIEKSNEGDMPVDSFDAFGISDDNDLFGAEGDKKPAAPPSSSAASSVLDDLLSAPAEIPAATTNATNAGVSTFDDKEFDDFFNDVQADK